MMVLGGLQKNSLIDYPGKVSSVLFLSGCNFDCPYCHNPALAKGSPLLSPPVDEETVYDFLESRRSFLDGVVISGGEPTLHKGLVTLCEKIKQMGYPVKLDTNGSRPQVIKTLADEGLVDYIAMDVKTDPLRYSPLTKEDYTPERILSSIKIIMESNLPHEFKTTCIKPLVDVSVIETISRLIEGSDLYALQRFQRTEVLHPEFFEENEYRIEENELLHLKSVAEPWVKRCIIR
jgi:pyruvate formate lyase activating enzyme